MRAASQIEAEEDAHEDARELDGAVAVEQPREQQPGDDSQHGAEHPGPGTVQRVAQGPRMGRMGRRTGVAFWEGA